MTSKPIDADVGFNRENVALARSQKLIASWFPSSGGNLLQDKDEDDSEDQYEVEVNGIGGKNLDADEALGSKRPSAALSKLMEQMVGKQAAKNLKKGGTASQHKAPKPLEDKKPRPIDPGEESDESQGRAAMLKAKPSRKRARTPPDDDSDGGKGKAGRGSAKRKGGGASYLDQVLAQKGRKKGKH